MIYRYLTAMKLYHYSTLGLLLLMVIVVTAGCSSPELAAPRKNILVAVDAGSKEYEVELSAGSTVQDVLDAVDEQLEGKDRDRKSVV